MEHREFYGIPRPTLGKYIGNIYACDRVIENKKVYNSGSGLWISNEKATEKQTPHSDYTTLAGGWNSLCNPLGSCCVWMRRKTPKPRTVATFLEHLRNSTHTELLTMHDLLINVTDLPLCSIIIFNYNHVYMYGNTIGYEPLWTMVHRAG